jgi:uncharacterized protein (TIGR02145 family)
MISTIKIGNQIWMTENLAVTIFRNGEKIPFYHNIQDFLKAGRHHEPACCYYENNQKKGLLYNWFAANYCSGIAPEGFKIPSQNDWEELFNYCGGAEKAAINFKSSYGWVEPAKNVPKPEQIIGLEIGNGRDNFGFIAKPMGALLKTELFAEFFGYGRDAYFWTADTVDFYNGWGKIVYMYYYAPNVTFDTIQKRLGMSVRCIKIQ